MRVFGYILVAVGLGLALAGLGVDASVQTDGLGRVNNIGLLVDKLMLVVLGGFAFLSGVVLLGFSSTQNTAKAVAAAPDEGRKPDPFEGQY